MPTVIELPDGQSATLRDPKTVTRAQRIPLEMANLKFQRISAEAQEAEADLTTPQPVVPPVEAPPAEEGVEEEPKFEEKRRVPTIAELEAYDELDVARVVCMVESWTYDFPVTPEGFGNIPAMAADVLSPACDKAAAEAFFKAAPTPDEASPTQPSDA